MNRRGYSDDDNDERMVMIDADALGWLPQQVVEEHRYDLNLLGAHFLHCVGERVFNDEVKECSGNYFRSRSRHQTVRSHHVAML